MGVVVFLHKVTSRFVPGPRNLQIKHWTSPTTGLTCIIQKSYSRIQGSVRTGIVITTLNYVEKSKEKKNIQQTGVFCHIAHCTFPIHKQ